MAQLPTIFLSDVTPVPASAMFRGGAAYAQTGERYVSPFPSNSKVHYFAGLAYRDDGALCINPAGVLAARLNGIAVTSLGEVLTSTSAEDIVKDGLPFLQATGQLCVTAQS